MNQELFKLLRQEHGIIATQDDMEAIIEVVLFNFMPDPADTGANRRVVLPVYIRKF